MSASSQPEGLTVEWGGQKLGDQGKRTGRVEAESGVWVLVNLINEQGGRSDSLKLPRPWAPWVLPPPSSWVVFGLG